MALCPLAPRLCPKFPEGGREVRDEKLQKSPELNSPGQRQQAGLLSGGLRPRAMSLCVTRPRDGFAGAGGDAGAGGAAGAPWGAAPPRAAAGPLGAAGNPRPCGRHRGVRTLLVHRGRDAQGTDRAETGREVTATEDFWTSGFTGRVLVCLSCIKPGGVRPNRRLFGVLPGCLTGLWQNAGTS